MDGTPGMARPRGEQLPVRAGNKAHLVTRNGCRELFNFLAVAGFAPGLNWFASPWPNPGLREKVIENWLKPQIFTPAMHCGSEGKGMLEKLRGIEPAVTGGIIPQRIPDTLKPLHAFTPNRSPVSVA